MSSYMGRVGWGVGAQLAFHVKMGRGVPRSLCSALVCYDQGCSDSIESSQGRGSLLWQTAMPYLFSKCPFLPLFFT